MELFVQYGCGLSAPAGWRNFDASPTLRLQRLPIVGRFVRGGSFPVFPPGTEYGDIVKGLPLDPAVARAIYCSHVLEHLSLEGLRVALRNTYRYLAPGGLFRLVVPDLERLADHYLHSTAPDASLWFMEASGLGRQVRPRTPGALLRDWLGNSGHLWMWDYRSLEAELQAVGLTGVRRAAFGDSAEARFAEVEESDRWEGCLGMECTKP